MKKPSRSALSNGVPGASNHESSIENTPSDAQDNTSPVGARSNDARENASDEVSPADAVPDGEVPAVASGNETATGIESHMVARVLVLTSPLSGRKSSSDAASDSSHTHAIWSETLARAGHQVSWTERDEWKPDAIDPCGEDAPQVILFEAAIDARELDAIAALCAEIKSSGAAHCTALLVALPAKAAPAKASFGKKSSSKNGANGMVSADEPEASVVARLQEAGADDFLTSASQSELLARVGVLAGLARVRAELEATREHLRAQMQLDDLTRLLNRRFFFQAAHREYGRARRYNHDLSCLMVDVNGFKQINAAFGYECGDAVLRQVALVLRDSTRDCDILARWGEEKFVVLLPETPLEGAITLRENIARAVAAQTFTWRERDWPLSISVGEAARRLTRSAQAPAEAGLEFGAEFDSQEAHGEVPLSLREEMAGLLEEADAALYVAKRGVRFQALPGAPNNQMA